MPAGARIRRAASRVRQRSTAAAHRHDARETCQTTMLQQWSSVRHARTQIARPPHPRPVVMILRPACALRHVTQPPQAPTPDWTRGVRVAAVVAVDRTAAAQTRTAHMAAAQVEELLGATSDGSVPLRGQRCQHLSQPRRSMRSSSGLRPSTLWRTASRRMSVCVGTCKRMLGRPLCSSLATILESRTRTIRFDAETCSPFLDARAMALL